MSSDIHQAVVSGRLTPSEATEILMWRRHLERAERRHRVAVWLLTAAMAGLAVWGVASGRWP